ncbi:M16 family metallopeptidase [Mobilicoccus pelagius]|uniref:Peptidase M16 family protein n=1 Tax=Mobilicoccus pelagius NBRC 104925 TaxID=1089455 RepID=H5URS3_9MICO|nr:pitrilysin family protein [Mobilicoccus pelagius]GAB48431.1 peptidase M16 family protein [Mobilicoccus pelagius NBRC 104925]
MPLDYPVETTTLPNGLRVVVSEDHASPVVAVNLWVGVGSRHEQEGRTGFAHLFEHLMFQGSRHVASGEHFSALMGVGARLNATTWFDRTNYFETLPSGALDLALWMEADRHGYLLDAVTQENLDNQRDVVKEEKRQRYDNQPYGEALHHLYANVFPEGHPYHHSTIGSMADLDAATLEDVHAFFRRWYHPGNTVLTLCGDVTPEAGFAGAERYFGDLARGEDVPPASTPPLPPLPDPVHVDVDQDVPAPRLYLGFRLPADHAPEFDAAGLALEILGGTAISRLEKNLVRGAEIATFASSAPLGLADGTSLGFLAAQPAEGITLTELEEAIVVELTRLAEEGPSPVEMEAASAQNEREWLSTLASVEERADQLGRLTTLYDDPEGINTYLDRLDAVTAEDVRRAVATWLAPKHRVVVAYAGGATDEPVADAPAGTDASGAADDHPTTDSTDTAADSLTRDGSTTDEGEQA